MPANSLLFVPDITGFTKFVNKTETDHGQHIISELLENIIDSNHLDLAISEIEGDAVFFYKEEELPGANEIYEQAKKMFFNFHAHLKLYETRRICQCGACSSAAGLSLKFVVHCGEIGFTNIKNHRKPFGSDIVLVHRLLKNNVNDEEYVLFTKRYLDASSKNNKDNEPEDLQEGVEDYQEFGLVNYKFGSLSGLRKDVPNPPPLSLPAKMKNPQTLEHVFDLPAMDVYEYLSNFELKKQWNDDVSEFKFEKGKVNRIGTKHICVFDQGKAELESVTNDFGKGNIVYGERLLKFPLAKDFTFYFILTPLDDKTKVRVEVHYMPIPIIGWLLKPIINMNIKKINKKFISSFSKLGKIDNFEDSLVTM